MSAVTTRPVGPDELDQLAQLFDTSRTTRRCWCMAFCLTRTQFAAGWMRGGNQRRFRSMAAERDTPMGILALRQGEPVGWCACGPRSRYVAGRTTLTTTRTAIMQPRSPAEDDAVWLVPCLYVRPGHRGQGVTRALLAGAVDLARGVGAAAIEGWPLARSEHRAGEAFLGREEVFEALGFRNAGQPTPGRVIMRLGLGSD